MQEREIVAGVEPTPKQFSVPCLVERLIANCAKSTDVMLSGSEASQICKPVYESEILRLRLGMTSGYNFAARGRLGWGTIAPPLIDPTSFLPRRKEERHWLFSVGHF